MKNKKPVFLEFKTWVLKKFQLFSTGKDNINWLFVVLTLVLLVFTLVYMNNKIGKTSKDFK
jgi:NADH:ubiquinone oxidoreductase subunit 4 (subunit M)